MVTTRKSTGKLPPPKYANLQDDVDVKSEDNEFDYDLEIHEASSRKRSRTRRDGGKDFDDDGDDSDYDDSKAAKNSRRNKRARTAKSKNAGKLAKLLNMPVDVFCEITGHLTPLDLLHLARSSRVFRDLLLSKSSKAMWRSARAGIDLPECPPDISEPRYASLVFDKECHVCGAPRVNKIQFCLRIRLCKPCYAENVIYSYGLMRDAMSQSSNIVDITSLLPSISGRYFGPHYKPLIEKYMSFGDDVEGRNKFVAERQEISAQIVKHSTELDIWVKKEQESKREVGHRKERNRSKSIHEKLLLLGYSKEDFEGCSYFETWEREWQNIVYQPRELTARIWKNIQPKLEELICQRRESKKKEKRFYQTSRISRFYEEFANSLVLHGEEKNMWLPSSKDVHNFPSVLTLLAELERDDISVTDKHWRIDILPLITFEIGEFEERVKGDVISKLIRARLETDNQKGLKRTMSLTRDAQMQSSSNRLLLKCATSYFRCPKRDCCFIATFPAIMEHYHTAGREFPTHPRSSTQPWDPDLVTYTPRMWETAVALLRDLNYPTSTLASDMESLESRFVCARCHPLFRKKRSWKELLLHYDHEYTRSEKSETTGARFDIAINEKDLTYVNDHKDEEGGTLAVEDPDFEPLDPMSLSTDSEHKYQCRPCRLMFYEPLPQWMSLEQLRAHFDTKHPTLPLSKEQWQIYPNMTLPSQMK